MKTHRLKIKRMYHERIVSGDKSCEIRLNDRDYQRGDVIQFLVKWKGKDRPGGLIFDGDYLVCEKTYEITHVLRFPDGLKDGYVALSIIENQ